MKSNVRVKVTLPFASGADVTQRAPPMSASGHVSGAGPIHFAFQPSDGMMPVTHSDGTLHADASPLPSHVRTFHQYRRDEASGAPAYTTSTDRSPATFPESHMSPESFASFSAQLATSTR